PMERRSVVCSLHQALLSSTSVLGLKARGLAFPLMVGTAISLGVTANPAPVLAATAVSCTPDPADGTASITTNELCTNASGGTFIDYATNPATASGNVTLQGVNGVTGGVSIDNGGFDVGLLDTAGNASSLNGIVMTGTGAGNLTVNLQSTTINNVSNGI